MHRHTKAANTMRSGMILLRMFCSLKPKIPYTNDTMTTIKNCIGSGKMGGIKEGDKPYLVIFGCSNAGVSAGTGAVVCPIENNALLDTAGAEYYSYATSADNSINVVKLDAYMAEHPNAILLKSAAEITELLNAQPTQPEAPVAGDGIVWIAVIAAVSVLGMAVALKAGKNN